MARVTHQGRLRIGVQSIGNSAIRSSISQYSTSKSDDGSDLLSQAKAASNKNKKTFTESEQSENAGSDRPDPEAERIKRVLDAADKEANEKLGKNARSTGIAVLLGLLASYGYMGYSSELPANDGDNAFVTHNKRVWDSLKQSLNVSVTNSVLG